MDELVAHFIVTCNEDSAVAAAKSVTVEETLSRPDYREVYCSIVNIIKT